MKHVLMLEYFHPCTNSGRLQATSADVAVCIAGLVGLTLASMLDTAALDAWGWRLALLLGAAIVPLGLTLRRTLEETRPGGVRSPAPSKSPATAVEAGYGRIVVLGLILLSSATIIVTITEALPARVRSGGIQTACEGKCPEQPVLHVVNARVRFFSQMYTRTRTRIQGPSRAARLGSARRQACSAVRFKHPYRLLLGPTACRGSNRARNRDALYFRSA